MKKWFLLLLLTTNVLAGEAPMLMFPEQVQAITAPDDYKSPHHPNLLSASPVAMRIEGDNIIATLVVENKGASALRIAVFPIGGEAPYGGTSPFRIYLKPHQAVQYQETAAYPPEPPLPMLITFPAKTKIHFTAKLGLKALKWSGAPKVSVAWGFHFANGTALEGADEVQLPKAPTKSGK